MVKNEEYEEEIILDTDNKKKYQRESRTMSATSRRKSLEPRTMSASSHVEEPRTMSATSYGKEPRTLSAESPRTNLKEPRAVSADSRRSCSLDEMISITSASPDDDVALTASSRRRFVFDHLWGIPGDTGDTQLRFLQQLNKKKVSKQKYF